MKMGYKMTAQDNGAGYKVLQAEDVVLQRREEGCLHTESPCDINVFLRSLLLVSVSGTATSSMENPNSCSKNDSIHV